MFLIQYQLALERYYTYVKDSILRCRSGSKLLNNVIDCIINKESVRVFNRHSKRLFLIYLYHVSNKDETHMRWWSLFLIHEANIQTTNAKKKYLGFSKKIIFGPLEVTLQPNFVDTASLSKVAQFLVIRPWSCMLKIWETVDEIEVSH